MFERFTKDARAVVKGAVEQAEETGARYVGADHLLLALTDGRAAGPRSRWPLSDSPGDGTRCGPRWGRRGGGPG